MQIEDNESNSAVLGNECLYFCCNYYKPIRHNSMSCLFVWNIRSITYDYYILPSPVLPNTNSINQNKHLQDFFLESNQEF